MSVPSPFANARDIGNRMAKPFSEVRDANAMDNILSRVNSNSDPQTIQDSIGQILSQVSPERQKQAIEYLDMIQNSQRVNRIFGRNPQAQGNNPQQGQMPPGQPQQAQPQEQANQPYQNQFTSLNDDQLIELSGVKGFSEPAKQELKRRQEDRKLKHKMQSDVFKSQLDRSSKVLESSDKIAEQIPQKQTALNLMQDAIARKNLGFFSPDNLAELTGIEGLRSPEGALFKTAGKEYFLGNISRAGARPNQWIEQQIQDMLAKIGRSPEANISVLRALQNELDLDQERVRLTNEISDKLSSQGDLGQGKLGYMVNQELKKYAEDKQLQLFNDLRAIQSVGNGKVQKYRKVPKGTYPSPYMIEALNNQFKGNWEKASEEAKKLGYDVDG